MSQENVEVVGSVWDAWNRGDLEGILDGISPESEFHPSGRFMDTQRVYRGREEYVDFWREFRAAWEEIRIGIERSRISTIESSPWGPSTERESRVASRSTPKPLGFTPSRTGS